MGTERGTGPATPASPALPADEITGRPSHPPSIRAAFRDAASKETHWRCALPDLEAPEEDSAGAAEIEATFRLRIIGLRRLRRRDRAPALRAARDWRFLALKALREKRAADRRARYEFWRSRLPGPKPG